MNAATITALSTAIPAILGAITAVIMAIKGRANTNALAAQTRAAFTAHLYMRHAGHDVKQMSETQLLTPTGGHTMVPSAPDTDIPAPESAISPVAPASPPVATPPPVPVKPDTPPPADHSTAYVYWEGKLYHASTADGKTFQAGDAL